MNDKIRELAEQAIDYAGGKPMLELKDRDLYLDNLFEKFAELIVQECADACYKHKDVESFGIYPIRVAMVTKACSDNIKQHFGVEE